jgi:hypothetical protein
MFLVVTDIPLDIDSTFTRATKKGVSLLRNGLILDQYG